MILLFCGPVGAGKSTITNGLARELKRRGKDHYLISSDEIKGRVYEKIFQLTKRYVEKECLLLDATFYRKKWRDKIKEIAGNKKVITIFIDCSLETCLIRNKERENPVEEKAVHIIYKEFERPRGVDIYINTEKLNPREAVKIIISKINIA